MSELADLLPSDFEGREAITNQFKDVAGLAKSYREIQSKVGGMMSVPKEPSERLGVLRKHFGAGESPDDYALPDGPDDIKTILSALREEAAGAGVPKSAWDKLAGKASEMASGRRSEFESQMSKLSEQWDAEARKDLGDKYDEVTGAAQRVVTELAKNDPSIATFLDATGLGNNGAMTRFMQRIFKQVAPDSIISGEGGGGSVSTTPQQLRDRVIEIQASEDWKKENHHPIKQKLQREVTAAYKALGELGFNSIMEVKDDE
ncbi:MAG: hypothetical protein KDH09_03350 [Chrysiogenetes bacterium]|nr:hypothetical protein [Chrysiogenetes bacterium]